MDWGEYDLEILAGLTLIVSYGICHFVVPKIINAVNYKGLMDSPNHRSSHSSSTPTLGGVAFFVSLIFSFYVFKKYDQDFISLNFIVGLTLIFIVGVKDDLMVLSARTKIIAQLVSITFVLILPEFHDSGLILFEDQPLISGIIIYLFGYTFILYIINAYNLIDGIDGLASLIGLSSFAIYAYFFYRLGMNFYFLMSLSGFGFMLAFLRYNISQRNKIFMGDTGSLIVGFLIGVLSLRFLLVDPNQLEEVWIKHENLFIIVISVLFFPVVDVIRVMAIRWKNGSKVFSADRRHLHHILIDKGLPHLYASVTLMISGIIVFSIIYLANYYVSFWSLLCVFLICTFLTYYILMLLDTSARTRITRKKFKSHFPDSVIKQEFRVRKKIIIFLKKTFYKNY